MKTSELLRATRKRFDERLAELRDRNDRMRKIDRSAELEQLDVGSQLEHALFDAAGGVRGYAEIGEAERVLELITSPLWSDFMATFDRMAPDATAEQWRELRAAGVAAQRDLPLKEWLAAPGRQVVEVQTVLTRAFARAVKEERENG